MGHLGKGQGKILGTLNQFFQSSWIELWDPAPFQPCTQRPPSRGTRPQVSPVKTQRSKAQPPPLDLGSRARALNLSLADGNPLILSLKIPISLYIPFRVSVLSPRLSHRKPPALSHSPLSSAPPGAREAENDGFFNGSWLQWRVWCLSGRAVSQCCPLARLPQPSFPGISYFQYIWRQNFCLMSMSGFQILLSLHFSVSSLSL